MDISNAGSGQNGRTRSNMHRSETSQQGPSTMPLSHADYRRHSPQLVKARVFSTVDAKNDFWHLKLDKESSKLTTFESPFGRFRWLRLPLGVSPAPELFQARIHEDLRGLQGIASIADDILIFGSGDNMNEARLDHDKNLLNLLKRCRTTGLRLNKDKFQLNRAKTTYMGYQLTANGLQPDPKKVEAIRQMPLPTDRKGVMRLLGMATFLAKFCPNFSEVKLPSYGSYYQKQLNIVGTKPPTAWLSRSSRICWH